MPRGRAIATAVVWRAEMRAAFQDFTRNADVGLTWIKARIFRPAARICRNATGFRCVGFVLVRPPVYGPFPDIADHVVDAVTVGEKGGDGRGALVSVLAQILARKNSLPGVGHVLAAGRERIAPGELLAVEAAARGKFPFGFGRQLLAGP